MRRKGRREDKGREGFGVGWKVLGEERRSGSLRMGFVESRVRLMGILRAHITVFCIDH